MYYIGIMSGTSLDGIDAILVRFPPAGGVEIIDSLSQPFTPELQTGLTKLLETFEIGLQQLGELDARLGRAYASVANQLIENAGIARTEIAAIGCHGQTIFHSPRGALPFTMQIGDGNRIAAQTGVPVVCDFRRLDMAVGGDGAPLTPAFHQHFFSSDTEQRAILNLGGIANITLLNRDPARVIGFDCGPANCLMDLWCQHHLKAPFDRDGQWAQSGQVHPGLLRALLAEPYFQLSPPKSTGKELFNLDWLQQHLKRFEPLAAEDVQATLLELTALSIVSDLKRFAPECKALYLCGGGAYNRYLIERLNTELARLRLALTDEIGISAQWVEAIAFAWFARQRIELQPANLPSVTGASRPVVLGALYQN
ncbi:anhydro-N-acetylmuramic acid kinase [Dongshaea marina]|uniref:anhydro-N-acetylmuramic acid kinase n=1 Tax=Dongshaea marina TaxID=2047966 RepID=UPI000D3E300E|nr:anhydro-N-acetylmuramic acid kinase [Dongshaea marina]